MATNAQPVTEVAAAIEHIRTLLSGFVFRGIRDEADLQEQVYSVMLTSPRLRCSREVIAARGRYDLLVAYKGEGDAELVIVLELKVRGSAAAVERQAQRYALTDNIDAVVVATTSNRLARSLQTPDADTLGGKPFNVITLRVF